MDESFDLEFFVYLKFSSSFLYLRLITVILLILLLFDEWLCDVSFE